MTSQAFVCSLRDCCSSDWYTFPEDHRCPHDSWVGSITILEASSGERQEKRGLEIRVQLLGAWHDGTIEFTYKDVRLYSLKAARDGAAHGDWLKDEIEVKEGGSLLHRVTLASGSLEIEAEDIEYKWTPTPIRSDT